MAALATDADLEARIGRPLTAAESARSAALLADASALIRRYAGQQFDAVAADEIVLRPVGSYLRLPQRPVTDVTSVVAVGYAPVPDLTLPAGSWAWDGIDTIELSPLDGDVWLSLPASWADGYAGPDTYRVAYDHGDADVPADVVAVCCRMVLAVLLAPTMAEGLGRETIGQYSYGYQQGMAAPGATVRLTEVDRRDLAAYRRTSGTIAVKVR